MVTVFSNLAIYINVDHLPIICYVLVMLSRCL